MNFSSFAYLVILLQLVNFSVQQCTSTYTVRSGDYCLAIANNYGLTVDQLAALNSGLNCNNLQVGQVLCMSYTYATTAAPVTLGAVPYGCTNPYYVRSGDTCSQIMNTYGISQATFTANNPYLNCNNLQVGQCVCLSYAAITTAAPATLGAVPYGCTYPYYVRSGDTCYQIMNTYGISQATFTANNPYLNCNDLQVGQCVCLSYAAISTAGPVITAAPTTYIPPTTAAPTTYYPATTASPILCQRAYIVQAGDTCDLIARYNGLTIDAFYSLNPGINCAGLQVGQAVCLSTYYQSTVAPVVTTAAPVYTTYAPVATTFAACYCANPYYVKSGDYCYKIMSDYACDTTTFYNLNPGLNCNNLQVGQCVCLPARTAACTNNYAVRSGDYCWAIANNYGLTVDQLVALNPGLNCNNLQVGQVLTIRGTCY